jgi:hypothetical protein
MIQALATMGDGRLLVLLGLSQGNIDRLKAGKPIWVDPQVLLQVKPTEVIGGIALVYGATEAAIAKDLETLFGPETEVKTVPRGSTTPT